MYQNPPSLTSLLLSPEPLEHTQKRVCHEFQERRWTVLLAAQSHLGLYNEGSACIFIMQLKCLSYKGRGRRKQCILLLLALPLLTLPPDCNSDSWTVTGPWLLNLSWTYFCHWLCVWPRDWMLTTLHRVVPVPRLACTLAVQLHSVSRLLQGTVIIWDVDFFHSLGV